MAEEHRCDEKCVCSIHDLPMFYHKPTDDHACQNSDCEFALGMREYSVLSQLKTAKKEQQEFLRMPEGFTFDS